MNWSIWGAGEQQDPLVFCSLIYNKANQDSCVFPSHSAGVGAGEK